MKKKVLVTGGTGFTGFYLCKRLIEEGFQVRALARQPSRIENLEKLGAEVVLGDLAGKESLFEAAKDIHTVYHLAAAYRQEGLPRGSFRQTNIEGTKNILEAALKNKARRFIHCSTVGVQGEIKNPPATEKTPYNPGDIYQKSKCEGEKTAVKFFRENPLPGVIFRPAGIYGPGDMRFLKLFRYIHKGKFHMLGNGNVLYHLTYIDDLIDGIILCGKRENAIGEIYTLGGSRYTTLNELVEIIAEAMEVKLSKKHFPVRPVYFAGWLCELACRPFDIEPPIYRRR